MKVTIELSRIWSEDGQIDKFIIKELAREIKVQLIEKHEDEFQKKVAQAVSEEVYKFVVSETKEKVRELLEKSEQDIGWPINTNEPMTLERHLINAVKQATGSHSNWKTYFNEIGEKVRKELKERYDKEFAATIVDSMVKNNMLKEDVIKMLIK